MPVMQRQITQIWCCYNHLPGGQMVAIHFEDHLRMRKGSNRDEEIIFTAKAQLESFKKGKQVALFLNGKLIRNEVCVYEGPSLIGLDKAPNIVLEYARSKGVAPILTKAGKEPLPHEHTKRIETLEASMNEVKSAQQEILDILKKNESKKS